MSSSNSQEPSSDSKNEEESLHIRESRKLNDRKKHFVSDTMATYNDDIMLGDIVVKVLPMNDEVNDIVCMLKLLWIPYKPEGIERIKEIQQEIKLLRRLEALDVVIEDSWLWYCIPSDVKRIINKASYLPKLNLPEWPKDVERRHHYYARRAAKKLFEAGFWEEDIEEILYGWANRCANSMEISRMNIREIVGEMLPWAKYWRAYAGYTLAEVKDLNAFRSMNK